MRTYCPCGLRRGLGVRAALADDILLSDLRIDTNRPLTVSGARRVTVRRATVLGFNGISALAAEDLLIDDCDRHATCRWR